MRRFALISIVSAILLTSLAFSLTINLVKPDQSEYSWGAIPVYAKLLDNNGSAISNATVYASDGNNTVQLTWDQSSEMYIGSLNIIKMGDYTIRAWSVVNGLNATDSKSIYVNSSKIELDIIAPTGEYAPGNIPVKLSVLVGGEERQDVNASVSISNQSGEVWNSSLGYPYSTLVKLGEGDYNFKAVVAADNNMESNNSSFTVSSSKVYLSVVNPKPDVYSGTIPIDVDLWSNGEFVHHAYIQAIVLSGNKTIREIQIPEAQYHYSSQLSLGPGFYTINIEANYSGNILSKSINITVPGVIEKNGTQVIIPGNKELGVNEIWTNLQRRYFSTGSTGTFAVSLVDKNTGSYISNANVSCCVHHGNKTDCGYMKVVDKPIPNYEFEYTFNAESWYEAVINITAPGYKNVTYKFPPIKVGKPEVIPPTGYEVIKNYIFTIIHPEKSATYPSGEGIGIRVQLLDKEGMPITNASINASVDNKTFPLDYDINGEYYAKTQLLDPGKYNLTVTVDHNNTKFSRSIKFIVSRKTLAVNIINPKPGLNTTNRSVTINAEVLDESGDMVPDADVKAILTSPKTGSHTIDLVRNLETGYYTIDYQLDSPGDWKVEIVASKPGYLDGRNTTTFKASFEEERHFSTRDVVAGAVAIAAILIIIVIVRAIL